MAEDNSQTPDQVAAGAYPVPEVRDQGSLMDALRSRGTMPTGLMEALVPPQGANPALAAASGVLNAQAGINNWGNAQAGQNPYLQQQFQQQKLAAEQQMQTLRLQERMQAEQSRQLDLSRRIMAGALETMPDGPARSAMAQQYAGVVSRQTGSPLTADFATALATRTISSEDIQGILMDAANGMNAQLIAERHPKVPPRKIQDLLSADPATLDRLSGETEAQRRAKVADQRLKELQTIEKEYPVIKGHPEMSQDMLQAHRQLNRGLSFEEGTPETRSQAYEIAKYKALQRAESEQASADARKLALEGQLIGLREGMASRLQTQRDIAAEERLRIRGEQTKTTLAQKKKQQALVGIKTFVDQFHDYIDKLDNEGFLPKDGGVYEMNRARAKQGRTPLPIPGYSVPNDPIWRGWLDLQGNFIGFAREVQGDIGPRAMAAFLQAVRVSEDPPTKAGLLLIEKQMREQIKAAEQEGPPGEGAGPLQTRLPKNATVENGEIVSKDGKYRWDRTQKEWLPR